MLIRLLFAVFILNAVILTGCQSKKNESESSAQETDPAEDFLQDEESPKLLGADSPPYNPKTFGTEEEKESKTTSIKNSDLTEQDAQLIISSYVALKSALVNDKIGSASRSAGEIVETLLLKKDEFSEGISAAAEKIMQSTLIEDQREHFSALSKSIYTLANEVTLSNELYYQYCPMAFNNRGAYWLSSDEEIRNPYFGDEMLRCGSTKEIIQ